MKTLPKSLPLFILHFMSKRPLPFIFFLCAPLLVIFETNFIPYSIKIIIDTIIENEDIKNDIFDLIYPQIVFITVAWVGSMTALRLIHYWEAWVLPYFESDIRISTLDYISYHSYRYFSNQLSGNISNKVSDLCRSIMSIIDVLSWNCISTLSVIVVALILMSTISIVFSIIFGIWVIIHLCISFYFVKFINISSEKNARDKSMLSGHTVDIISNIGLVKLLSGRNFEIQRFLKFQNIEIESNKNLILSMNLFQVCIYIPISIMIALVIYFLISFWQKELITTGDFVFVFNSIFFTTQQMWSLSNALANLFRDVGIAKQALNLITKKHEIIDSKNATQLLVNKGKIVFNNVNFKYPGSVDLFNKFNLVINEKEKVGLVGVSGSGKTTFVNLLLRLFEIQSGSICIDGQNIQNVTQDSLRQNINTISQGNDLFNRTIIENLRYNNEELTDNDIKKAAKASMSHSFINSLTKGYHSKVGEKGVNLSGGQKQRLAITRALLKEAKIMVFDEATSALDSVTEFQIQQTLDQAMKDKTAIIIAHRLSTIRKVDRIIVFDQGKIVESGTHEELIEMKGHYFTLWSMQKDGVFPYDL